MAFFDDSDEEQEADEDMLLACVLVGEYLSEKEERPKFYAINKMAWEKHISESTAEMNDAFQQLYRMEYSSIVKLCSIISPQSKLMMRCPGVELVRIL